MNNQTTTADTFATAINKALSAIGKDMGSARLMRYFTYQHLPENLQTVSKPIHDLANEMQELLPNSPEKTAGMRKLLEAKDCFVRANLPDA